MCTLQKAQGCFNWAWLTQLQSESMHSKILFCAAQEWSGSRSWYSSKDSAFLLPNCLKAYNVHGYNVSACYQSVPLMLAMCLLVTNVSLKASQMRGHLNTCHQSVPFLSPNIPMLVNKVSQYILVLICFLIATEVTKLG